MKKLILSLFLFCSVFAFSQTIPITQIIGLPSSLASKEPLLPPTPVNPESKILNGNRQWSEIAVGSGGYASNVYFTNLTSTIVGTYKQTSRTADASETIASATCNNNEVLIYTYLFEQPVGVTTVDAGVWRITLNSVIDAAAGDSKFKFVQFKRSALGVETDMFTVYSNTIENRVGYEGYLNNIFETVQPSFSTNVTDYLGCRIYATTTASGNRTLSYKVGDGFASYLSTPLAPRHDDLRDKNGNLLYQHPTSTQIATWNTTSANNTVDETLTSIKTKLGAATAVSDGYLKYQDWNMFNSKEPAISKNTGFNKNFGTTPGTVLEGRTFGTAAGSEIGDFIQNQRLAAQSANMWITGTISSSSQNETFRSINSTNNAYSARFKSNGGDVYFGIENSGGDFFGASPFESVVYSPVNNLFIKTPIAKFTGAATFSSTVNSTGFLLNGNNLTSGLSTNYIPKWNGSNFVNATAGTDYQLPITLTTNGTSGAATFSGNVLNVPNYTSSGAYVNISPSSVQSGSIWIDGIVNSSTVSAPSINTSYINFNSIPNGQQTSGSVSGNVIFNMPFNGAFYKKVIITLLNLQGSASWTFTSSFSNLPVVLNTDGLPSSIVTSKSLTSITLNCATPTSGILILEGY